MQIKIHKSVQTLKPLTVSMSYIYHLMILPSQPGYWQSRQPHSLLQIKNRSQWVMTLLLLARAHTHRFPCKTVFAVMPQTSALEQPKHCDKELKIWACSKISKKWDMPEKLHFTEGCLPERVYIVQHNVVVGFMVNDIRFICRQF